MTCARFLQALRAVGFNYVKRRHRIRILAEKDLISVSSLGKILKRKVVIGKGVFPERKRESEARQGVT